MYQSHCIRTWAYLLIKKVNVVSFYNVVVVISISALL